MAIVFEVNDGSLFLTQAFISINVSISHSRFKSLRSTLIDQYLVIF